MLRAPVVMVWVPWGAEQSSWCPGQHSFYPRGHLNLLGCCACLHSSGSALGCQHGKGTQQPQTPWFKEGPWDAVGCLPGSPFPSCQPAGWGCWGSQGNSSTSLLECPPGEEICFGLGHVWLASGKVRKVTILLLSHPPKISSPLEAQGQRGDTSACPVHRAFASELFSQQCSIKGSLCLGWDKGTSLIKLA